MSNFIPMTRAAYDRKRAEIDRIERDVLPEIAERIAAARDEGDLKENAEYHAQREQMGLVQAKVNKMKSDLSMATIMDSSQLPRDEIGFGATVVVKDLDYDDEEEITLVGSGDEDYDTGRYLITSPLGQGLVGKKVGDKVEIPVPKGTIKYEVLSINYAE